MPGELPVHLDAHLYVKVIHPDAVATQGNVPGPTHALQPRTEETWQHEATCEGNACCGTPGTHRGFYPAKTQRL